MRRLDEQARERSEEEEKKTIHSFLFIVRSLSLSLSLFVATNDVGGS